MWAVGVKDACNFDTQFVLAVVVEKKRLRAALALVVAGAYADGINPPPIAFWLGMNLGVTEDLAGGGLKIFAFTRYARPSMLIAPCTDVLVVCTGSNW